MAKQKEEDLATKAAAELATADFGEDAGRGFEGTTIADFSVPFISVLQAMSPQCQGSSKMKGAEAGMLFNTVTEELFSGEEGIVVVPAFRKQCYVEWRPREAGGGYIGEHDLTSQVVKDAERRPRGAKGQLVTESKNDLIQTAYFYCIIIRPDGEIEPGVLAFTSTKLKVYRHLMTKLNSFQVSTAKGRINPPLFSHQLRVKTELQKNQHGEFYNFDISPAIDNDRTASLITPNNPVYQAAKQLASQVSSGVASANYESAASGGGDEDVAPF